MHTLRQAAVELDGDPVLQRMVRGEPWECFHPVNKDQSARPWLGMEVTCRPDGGGWALETGIVHEHENHAPENGWFKLVNARYPSGILTHTQEVYPPGFTGCTLPCCRPNADLSPEIAQAARTRVASVQGYDEQARMELGEAMSSNDEVSHE